MARIYDEQTAYDLGFKYPATPARQFEFGHLIFANAFHCGQADAQNQAPRNTSYDRADYDPNTFERNL